MVRVLIVDDSVVVRQILAVELSKAADIKVVGTATDPYDARDKILQLKPDVLTLDLEMPRMDGLSFLRKLMQYSPMPVIVVSSLTQASSDTALEALRLGAVEVVAKPAAPCSVKNISQGLARMVRAAASARVVKSSDPPPALSVVSTGGREQLRATHKVLAIGASTGGTRAIENVLRRLPPDTPGTVIVQHMPEHFTRSFAKRLNKLCAMEIREAKTDDLVVPGVALIAPGDSHMLLTRRGAKCSIIIKNGPPVHYQCPSVDVLFHSVAKQCGVNSIGVILTGMGADGAAGLLAMRKAGARTIAQDEASCVIFGMPKEAINLGAAEKIVPLNAMSEQIMGMVAA